MHRARALGVLTRHVRHRARVHAGVQHCAHERPRRARVDHGGRAHGQARRRRGQLRRRRGHPQHTAQPRRRRSRRGQSHDGCVLQRALPVRAGHAGAGHRPGVRPEGPEPRRRA